MVYTITFLEKDYKTLQEHLFKDNNEQAAFILCGLSESQDETRFLVREVIPVQETNIVFNDSNRIKYSYESYLPVIKKALNNNECFILAHSHPNGYIGFSEVDDSEEEKLLKFVYNRLGKGIHGSLVFNNDSTFDGRIFNNTNALYKPISTLRVVGDIYRLIPSIKFKNQSNVALDIYNRNILAFGEDLQKILCDMHIGVIGCGGTGSALIEELCRMGVGKLTLIDHQCFEDTNVTRMHGSYIKNKGMPKVSIMEDMIKNIGLKTKVNPLFEKLDNKETVMKLRECDLIFSCLDNTHYARAILNSIMLYYYIPLIDTGIVFHSADGNLKDVFGRVDVVTPITECLLCRNVVKSDMCAAEMLSSEDYEKRFKEGYAPEILHDKVQAIPYNTLIASYAITELVQLLTNFKGNQTLHTVYRFNSNKTTNHGITGLNKKHDCLCSMSNIGKGDIEPLLGMCW